MTPSVRVRPIPFRGDRGLYGTFLDGPRPPYVAGFEAGFDAGFEAAGEVVAMGEGVTAPGPGPPRALLDGYIAAFERSDSRPA